MTQDAFDVWTREHAPAWVGHVSFLPEALERDAKQPEKTTPIWEYLDRVLTENRVRTGQAMLAKYQQELNVIQRRYGVAPEYIVAIWGLETNYGATMGDFHVPSAILTLAFASGSSRRRGLFFDQIRYLDTILASGIGSDRLYGSWAGAMGHTQFMPSAYCDYAVAFSQGRPDIWGQCPLDALTSTAHYLAENGWDDTGPDILVSNPEVDTDFAAFDGFAPYGSHGPMFQLGPIAKAVHAYNHSLHYVLAVDYLADKIAQRPVRKIEWPVGLDILKRSELLQIQTALAALGYQTNGVDGIWGKGSRKALIEWQESRGWTSDGYPTRDILRVLVQ